MFNGAYLPATFGFVNRFWQAKVLLDNLEIEILNLILRVYWSYKTMYKVLVVFRMKKWNTDRTNRLSVYPSVIWQWQTDKQTDIFPSSWQLFRLERKRYLSKNVGRSSKGNSGHATIAMQNARDKITLIFDYPTDDINLHTIDWEIGIKLGFHKADRRLNETNFNQVIDINETYPKSNLVCL